jgi:hypothetical protein
MFVIFRRWEVQSWTNSGYLRIAKFFAAVMLFTRAQRRIVDGIETADFCA